MRSLFVLLIALVGCRQELDPDLRPDGGAIFPDARPPRADADPGDPYQEFDTALRARLLLEMKGAHTTFLSYDKAREAMYFLPNGLDIIGGKIECVYTGDLTDPDMTRSPGEFNTEHSWPQSQGTGSPPAIGDIHHLFPAQGTANNQRSNLPFGMTDCNPCPWAVGGSEKGPITGTGAYTVFEVRPSRRGDIARAKFYVAVRYELFIDAPQEVTLRQWHEADPPDDMERARNSAIQARQGNSNIFIERPDLVERIGDF